MKILLIIFCNWQNFVPSGVKFARSFYNSKLFSWLQPFVLYNKLEPVIIFLIILQLFYVVQIALRCKLLFVSHQNVLLLINAKLVIDSVRTCWLSTQFAFYIILSKRKWINNNNGSIILPAMLMGNLQLLIRLSSHSIVSIENISI